MAGKGIPGGWSDAKSRNLPTYSGQPCMDCGGSQRKTKDKLCANGCGFKKRVEHQRNQRNNMKASGIQINRKNPEKAWKSLKPDFRQENLDVRNW